MSKLDKACTVQTAVEKGRQVVSTSTQGKADNPELTAGTVQWQIKSLWN